MIFVDTWAWIGLLLAAIVTLPLFALLAVTFIPVG